MKKLNLLLFIVFLSFNVFCQKKYIYENYGVINQHTDNSVLTINDKLVISKIENVFAILIYDPNLKKYPAYILKVSLKSYDELNERYIYIGDAIQEGIANGKCLINSSYKLDIYLENKGKENNKDWAWDGKLSFTVFFENLKFPNKSGHEQYIKDTSIKIFPIKNETVAMMQKENEEISKEEQKEEMDIEKLKKILSEVNIEEKVSQIKTEIENHYKSLLKDKMTNVSARDLLALKDFKTIMSLKGEFILHINKNKEIEIIKKTINYLSNDYSFNISDDESNYYNREALQKKGTYADEYKIGEYTYYILNNDIFTDDYKIDKNLSLESRTIGVNFKSGKFKYYTNENVTPQIVENWCSENIKTNGLYFINYILIDDELVCKILNLDRQTKEYLKQRFKIGLLNKY